MCRQQELLLEALHDAKEESSIWLLELELRYRQGAEQQREQAQGRANHMQHLCRSLEEVLTIHRAEHGC